MRLHGYVLAGDPAWATQSIRSYYDLVDRIVVSFDRTHRSWSGTPLMSEEAIAAIKLADVDDKVTLLPGDHHFPRRPASDVETEQRQAALDLASEGADWVLQLDTDELLLSINTFTRHLREADSRGADAMEYPLRDLYQLLPDGRFLEHCGRLWSPQAAYPGPVAVRSSTRLVHCRQGGSQTYRVDMRPWNTDPAHPRDARVHAVVAPDEAIAHLSWVRTDRQMAWKSRTSGHAAARDWDRDLALWRARRRRPWLTATGAPFARNPFNRFKVTRLPDSVPIEM